MKAVLTEKYEDAALAIYEKYSDVSEKMQLSLHCATARQ